MDDYPERMPWQARFQQLVARIAAFISRIGALAVWPFEFCLSFFLRLVLGGVEQVENADFFLSRVLYVLLAPLRWLWFLGGRFLALIRDYLIWPMEALFFKTMRALFGAAEVAEDHLFGFAQLQWQIASWWQQRQRRLAESSGVARLLRTLVAAPFVATGYLLFRLIHVFLWGAELLNLDSFIVRLIHWTRPLWYPFAALVGFFWSWFVTRDRRQLIWGIPLLLVLVPAGWVLAQNAIWGRGRIANQYRAAVATAREAKTFDRMQLFERKLAQLGVNTDATTFYTALSQARDGQIDDAYQRMCTIAPVDHPGYANAHCWIIQQILLDHVKIPGEKGNALVDAHFRQLASLGAKGPDIDLLRAFWLTRCDKPAEAADLLAPLVHTHPSAAIERMRLDVLLTHEDDARKDATLVEDFMEQSKRKGKSLTADDYQAWCVAEDILARYGRMQTIAEEWLKVDPANQDARAMLSRLRVQRLAQSLDDASANPDQLAADIRQGFPAVDTSPEVRKQVSELYRKRSVNPSLKQAFDQLVQAHDLPPALADVLGTTAAAEEDWAPAETLLEQVVRQMPNNAVARNNLAYVLLKRNGDLQRALAAATFAVQSDASNFHFRETRGQILVKLRRWQEAIDDLEFAVNGIPRGSAIHEALATAYEAVGNRQLAAVHRQQANSR